MLNQFTDNHWYRPLYRRVAVQLLLAAWLGVELVLEDSSFMTGFAVFLNGFAFYMFFLHLPHVLRQRQQAQANPRDAATDGDAAPKRD
ncbi:MAG: hypothetical protein K0U36_05580 [Alphaproteobacteria bacterium]|nr:hypothetical protein [Alphaproteobacteria bacterium]